MGSQWAAQWKVNSLTDPKKIYTVSVAKTGRWACDCPAHRFAKNGPDGNKPPCKHVRKVQGIEQVSGPVQSVSHNALMGAAAVKVAKQAGKTAVVVVNTPKVLIIQTRREVCLEED